MTLRDEQNQNHIMSEDQEWRVTYKEPIFFYLEGNSIGPVIRNQSV